MERATSMEYLINPQITEVRKPDDNLLLEETDVELE
jgi:hypothetical protein